MAGIGLLLLRTGIATITAWQGAGLITAADGGWLTGGAGLAAFLVAGALILGLLTPFAAALVAIAAATSASRTVGAIIVTHEGVAHGLVLIDAVALVLLGPGAFSIDARLFGRREIHIRESYRAQDE